MYYSYSCNSLVSLKLFPYKVIKNVVQSTTALYPPAVALLILLSCSTVFIKVVSLTFEHNNFYVHYLLPWQTMTSKRAGLLSWFAGAFKSPPGTL